MSALHRSWLANEAALPRPRGNAAPPQPLNITRLTQARRLFVNDLAPRHVQRANIRKWVRMVRLLGPKWRALPCAQ